MTRTEIVAEAARRLGDESTDFKADIDAAFNFVLDDLAADDCIGALTQLATSAITVADQRSYSAQTLTGMTGANWPLEILSIFVWGWGTDSEIPKAPNLKEFQALRMTQGEELTGRPIYWYPYPNMQTIQFQPPCGTDQAGETLEVKYRAQATQLEAGDSLGEIHREDIETVIWGLKARSAGFRDETVGETEGVCWQAYQAGKNRMWARLHNSGVGTVARDEAYA